MNYSNLTSRLSRPPRLNPSVLERIERLRRLSQQARSIREKMALAAQLSAPSPLSSDTSRG